MHFLLFVNSYLRDMIVYSNYILRKYVVYKALMYGCRLYTKAISVFILFFYHYYYFTFIFIILYVYMKEINVNVRLLYYIYTLAKSMIHLVLYQVNGTLTVTIQ